MNPDAVTPNMQPTIEDAGLYVLGGYPSRSADRAGRPFVDRAGGMLRDIVGSDTSFDYVCRTRPPVGKNGEVREPKRHELLAFKQEVTADIERAQPNVVLAVGKTAANWATQGSDQIMTLSGLWFRRKFGSHETWVKCVMDPTVLAGLGDGRYYKVPVSEHVRFWRMFVQEAVDEARDPQREYPECDDPARALDGVEILRKFSDVIAAIKSMRNAKLGGFDFETWRLRPYAADGRMLSLGLDDGNRTVAFLINHERDQWSSQQMTRLVKELRKMFKSGYWVAHNLPFDLEWLMELIGDDCAVWDWGCSQLMAWSINPGAPGDKGPLHLSLDFQTAMHFGVRIKQLTSAAANRADLRGVPIDDLLKYNAVDARYHRRLFERLAPLCKEADGMATYRLRVGRQAALLAAQRGGVPVCPKVNAQARERVDTETVEVLHALARTEGAQEFKRRFGIELDPSCDEHKVMLFRDVMGITAAIKENGDYTLDKKLIINEGDGRESVALTIRYGELQKLGSTYIDRMHRDHPKTLVYPDGRIHCNFSASKARSGRLSADSPNMQNWPSRTDPWIRSQLKAPPGYTFLHGDFGQVEARLMGMESRDPVWIQMLKDDYDVHLEWAEKAAAICPHSFRKFGSKDIGKYRKFIKNALVFPLFFGSSAGSVANTMEMDLRLTEMLVEEFWDIFVGIKLWQKDKWALYEETNRVSTLTGTHRYGPLSWNQVCNHPPQGAASDITVEGMVELDYRARERDEPWLRALLQIHDALISLVPNNKVEDAAVQMIESVFEYQPSWMDGVPLSFDVEYGPDLSDLTLIGSFRNDQL